MKAAAVTLLALLLVSCGTSSAPSNPSNSDTVQGRTFLSTAVTVRGARFDLVPGTQVRLIFNVDGNLSASSGCNTMGGRYRIEGGLLRFDGGGMTAMGCDPPRHAQDDWLARMLAANPVTALNGDELTLTAGDTVIRLADRQVVEPDLQLVGPLWIATTILSGDVASSLPAGVVATMQFAADGGVRVRTGCNDGAGRVRVEGDALVFADLATTKRACNGAAGQVESAMMAVLRSDPVAFKIDAANLTLQTGAKGLIFSGR